jgi:two-component system response regulator EvgA
MARHRCDDCAVSTVLIVDDSAPFRRQARALLEAEGCAVVGEAPDGRSGIELARTLSPEIVLLDIGLPDIDGFEVATRLAAGDTPPTVVLTSSREAAVYGLRLAASPAAGFVAKDELNGRAFVEMVARVGHVPGGRPSRERQ